SCARRAKQHRRPLPATKVKLLLHHCAVQSHTAGSQLLWRAVSTKRVNLSWLPIPTAAKNTHGKTTGEKSDDSSRSYKMSASDRLIVTASQPIYYPKTNYRSNDWPN